MNADHAGVSVKKRELGANNLEKLKNCYNEIADIEFILYLLYASKPRSDSGCSGDPSNQTKN